MGLLVTIVIQVANRVVNDAFDPWEYFSYFTIESSLINIVVFAVGAVMALRFAEDTRLYTVVRMSTVSYAIVTAGVYNLLLRNVPYEGFVGLEWPNEVIHVWVPLFILLDWFLSPGKPRIGWSALGAALVYPIAWLTYTLVRGAFSGIYPYPFIDPTGGGGWPSVAAYIVGLSAFIAAVTAGLILSTRRR